VVPNTVGKWKAKYRDFPKAGPDRRYNPKSVERWLRKHGKLEVNPKAAEPLRLNLTQTANKLAVRRQTVTEWRKLFPDFPEPDGQGRYIWAEVEEWAHKRGKDLPGQEVGRELDKDYELARAARALADTREFNLAILKRRYVSRERFEEHRMGLCALFVRHLENQPRALRAVLAGRDEAFVGQKLKENNDAFRAKLQEELGRGVEVTDAEIESVRRYLEEER